MPTNAGPCRPEPVWRVTTARPARFTTRSARTSIAVVAVLTGLTLLTLGIALGRGSTRRDPAQPNGPVDGPQTQQRATGTPGSDPTEAGAVIAATGFLATMTSRAYLTEPNTRASAVRAIVIPRDRDRLAAQAAEKAGPDRPSDPVGAAFAPAGASAWRLTPIGYRLDSFTTSRAVVEIWSVQVIAATGTVAVPASAMWATARLPLMWAEGAWKLDLDAATTEPGPTPGAGPIAQSPDLDVIAADRRFQEYRHGIR